MDIHKLERDAVVSLLLCQRKAQETTSATCTALIVRKQEMFVLQWVVYASRRKRFVKLQEYYNLEAIKSMSTR